MSADPYNFGRSPQERRLSFYQLYGFGLRPRKFTIITKTDEDNDLLPGPLPRLARAMDAAQTDDEVTAAAQAFLIAAEEYSDG